MSVTLNLTETTKRLRELAGKATPGPWRIDPAAGHARSCIRGSESIHTSGQRYVAPDGLTATSSMSFSDVVCEFGSDVRRDETASTARMIAALDPETVVALCDAADERDRLQAEITRLTEEVEWRQEVLDMVKAAIKSRGVNVEAPMFYDDAIRGIGRTNA